MLRCIRGTNAVEGFHQKIRQLVRGFNVSPRFVLALLHEFIYRWNVDLEIQVRGLSKERYGGWHVSAWSSSRPNRRPRRAPTVMHAI